MTDKVKIGLLAKVFAMAAMSAGLAYWYVRPVAPWRDRDDQAPNKSLLLTFLPDAEFTGEVAVDIHASPERIMEALHRVTVNDMPVAKWLATLRYLPARLRGKGRQAPPAAPDVPFLQQLQAESGNIELGERPGVEYVMGAIGKFHNLQDQQFVPLRAPHEFVAFDDPAYQKLAMSLTITPLAGGSVHRLRLTHGTHALSPASRWKFALYWLGIKPGGNLVSWLMLRAIKSLAERAAASDHNVRAREHHFSTGG